MLTNRPLNQRGYHVDRRRVVISTYMNVQSTLSVCWVPVLLDEGENFFSFKEIYSSKGQYVCVKKK